MTRPWLTWFVPGRERPRRAERYVWPLPADPLFSPAFALCGMTLDPSPTGAMLAAVLGPVDGPGHLRAVPDERLAVSPLLRT